MMFASTGMITIYCLIGRKHGYSLSRVISAKWDICTKVMWIDDNGFYYTLRSEARYETIIKCLSGLFSNAGKSIRVW